MRSTRFAAYDQRLKSMGPWPVWALAALFALGTILIAWPGQMIGNTIVQLQQIQSGQFTDWHPPLMAIVWRELGAQPQSLLVLNSVMYWAGIGLLADGLWRRRSPTWAIALLLVGLTPIASVNLLRVQRDNFMVSTLLLAAGLLGRNRVVSAWLAGFPSILLRTDAIFALPPLLVATRHWALRLGICGVLSVALFMLAGTINRTIFNAAPAHAEKSLQLFDIAGIQTNSGKVGDFSDIRQCYTPFWWDPLEDKCRAMSAHPNSITRPWIAAIVSNPGAYLWHRTAHFNEATFFLVDPLEDCRQDLKKRRCGEIGFDLLKDAITRNFLLWPITWLVIAGFLIAMPLAPLERGLVWSAMIFSLAHFVVGVSSEYRYFFWPELAVQLGLVLHIANAGRVPWRPMIGTLSLVWLAGLSYRYLPFVI